MKFKYKDKVEVVDGFYVGMSGTVRDVKGFGDESLSNYEYLVRLIDTPDFPEEICRSEWIEEGLLKGIDHE